MSQRRKYSEEFEREAVSLTRQPGATVSQVARDVEVGSNLLFRWRRELEGEGKSFTGSGVARDQELIPLKREFSKVRRERDFVARCGSVLRQGSEVKYELIQRCRGVYPVQLMCRRLKGECAELCVNGHDATP